MDEILEIRQFRIGNILNFKGEPHYISFLSLDIDDEYQDLIGVVKLGKSSNQTAAWNRADPIYSHLKPTPLTEEWLIKFGFEKLKVMDYYRWHIKVKPREEELTVKEHASPSRL